MLTYNDCLGLSGLTPEEVDAIARHEHLPAIVALEMGWSLCQTLEGKQLIRRMILDDIKDACRRGDQRTAIGLGLVFRHFLETHLTRLGPKKVRTGGAQGRPAPAEDDGDSLEAFVDTTAEPWIRARVNLYLTKMLDHFGLDHASVQERFRAEMQAAETRCAACTETRRCRRFLAGVTGAEPPAAFCPNEPLFAELARRSPAH